MSDPISSRYNIGFIRRYAAQPSPLTALLSAGWRDDVRWNPKVRTMSKYSTATGNLYYIEAVPYGERQYIALYVNGLEYYGRPFRTADDILLAVGEIERKRS
ncbi:MAG: hypothetical protein WCQ23_07470 [Candidatus Methanomethylophilaceae archaeon]